MASLVELIGESPGIGALRDQIRRLLQDRPGGARLPTILIEGETGTGKGLLAATLHRHGGRARGPFVDVNCAAIPESLFEAELFGFERGAFTDARVAKPGLFEMAHRGTLFLDEVGIIPDAMQAKLLKVIEDRVVPTAGQHPWPARRRADPGRHQRRPRRSDPDGAIPRRPLSSAGRGDAAAAAAPRARR